MKYTIEVSYSTLYEKLRKSKKIKHNLKIKKIK